MITRAYIHVAGPDGAGKTAFIEAVLHATDAWVLAARCQRDDELREPRESAPKADPELRRYREAGAGGVARFAFPGSAVDSDDFFMTDLMADYGDAVVLEGDNPLTFVDLSVFVASPPSVGGRLFVRRKRDRAKEARVQADAMERLLRERDGMALLLSRMIGSPILELALKNPESLEKTRQKLLEGIARARKAPPPKPTEHWGIAKRYAGIEHAQLVIVNIRGDDARGRSERLIADLARLRKDDELFGDILGIRGSRVPITAVVADLANPKDGGRRKAIARVRRALRQRAAP